MIYISSYISKAKSISDQVHVLAKEGFPNIELTGGTDFYDGFVDDLKNLKSKFNLNYRLHNYFPPPKKHFVFNLASLNSQVSKDSIEHAKRSIELSRELDSYILGFHAGFFIHIASDELGTDISTRELNDEDEAIDAFVHNLDLLQRFAGDDFKIYIENNVISSRNRKRFPDRKPSMLACYSDFLKLRKKIKFNFLLDVAHLKVSCKSLALEFSDELSALIQETDYVHISDNDDLEDENKPLFEDSKLLSDLNGKKYHGYDFTLEIFDSIDNIKLSHDNLASILNYT